MKFSVITLIVALACCATQLAAGTICPSVTPDPGITSVSGCNSIITITNGGTTIATVDIHPYEISEDHMVGVVNNSTSAVTSIPLTGSGIFGYDSDGICSPAGYIAASNC